MNAVAPTIDADASAGPAWDVIVIGAGPAGAMAGLLLARQRLRVLLVDRRSFPRPKPCGGCLNGRALASLSRAGLDDRIRAMSGSRFDAIRILHRSARVTLRTDAGYAVSRTLLDTEVVRAAIGAGCAFLPDAAATVEAWRPVSGRAPDVSVRRVRLHSKHRADVEARAGLVIVADGLGHASLRECGEFRDHVHPAARIGVGASVPRGTIETLQGTITMAVGHGGYVGAIETGDGLTTVAAALDPDHLRTSGGAASAVRAVLDESGLAVGQALDDADWSGTLPLTRRLVRPAAARVLVLGDAAGYVEPFTGEGIAWAYSGAEALAPIARLAVATPAWDPCCEQAWTDTYARRIGREQRWCRAVARLLRSDTLLGPAMALLRWQPGIARPLLAHLSAAPSLRHR